MRIEKINENKIRVAINREDVKNWNVNLKNLTENTPEAQDMFGFVLKQAEKDVNFIVRGAQLLVEAVPSNTEGFILLISKVDDNEFTEFSSTDYKPKVRQPDIKVKRKSKNPIPEYIFRFDNFENLCTAVREVNSFFYGKSRLYKYQNYFYIHAVPYDIIAFFEAENILMEFADKVENACVFEGFLNEHGKLMIEDNAFEVIANYFV